MSKEPCGPCVQDALNAKAHIQQQRANNAPAPLRASSAGLEVLTGKKTQAALETPEGETHKDASTPEEQPQPEAAAVEEVVEAPVEPVVPTQPKRSTRTKASVTTTVES
jgi:hypothetical protein